MTADTAMAALIGDRLYPLKLPATPTLPAVTYALVSETQDDIQDGPGWRTRAGASPSGPSATSTSTRSCASSRCCSTRGTDGPFGSSTVENAYQNHDPKTNRWQHVIDVLAIQPA